jgi:hypothetical protein
MCCALTRHAGQNVSEFRWVLRARGLPSRAVTDRAARYNQQVPPNRQGPSIFPQ